MRKRTGAFALRKISDFGKSRSIRKLIAELQSWIAELIERRDKLVEEMREPTLPELLMRYMDERRDERSDWSVSGQRKGTNMDLKKVSHAIAFLQEHEIASTEDLQIHLDEKEAAFSELDNTIRGKEKRLRDVQALVKASDSAERLLPIHHQYAAIGWKSKKEKFYQEHKAEIDEYNKALRDPGLGKIASIGKYDSRKIFLKTLNHMEHFARSRAMVKWKGRNG